MLNLEGRGTQKRNAIGRGRAAKQLRYLRKGKVGVC